MLASYVIVLNQIIMMLFFVMFVAVGNIVFCYTDDLLSLEATVHTRLICDMSAYTVSPPCGVYS